MNVDVGLPAVWFLDGPLHIERCLLVVTFSDVGHTVPAGEQRQFPASPLCVVDPPENAMQCDLVIKAVGFDAQQFHWEISMRAGPIGVFTARDLVQITEVGIGDTLKVMIVVTAKDFKLGDVDGE